MGLMQSLEGCEHRTYDPDTNKCSLTVRYLKIRDDRKTRITFWMRASGFCYFQGTVTT